MNLLHPRPAGRWSPPRVGSGEPTPTSEGSGLRKHDSSLIRQRDSLGERHSVRLAVILIAVALAPRTRIGHYEIVSLLGKGGMGEVYRATDTTLGRDVAIKVLPDEFTSDPERLARFEREARVLASLDHSYIASIHGLEEVDGVRFLVMQLAEGMELQARMKRGRIPIDEAISIAVKIAEALEAAHERGIVHRDLKPGNVMIDANDDVKVLDFGLAKAFEVEEPDDEDYSNSPTMLRGASRAGFILGTAGYMSPEQARGKRVDKRADIWAFGVVLWEMLTGKRLFEGETISDTIAAVLTRTPDMSALPAETPAYVRWVLERCLERDPRKRLRDIGEARLALEDQNLAVASQSSRIPAGHSPAEGRQLPVWLGWVLSAVLLALLVGSLLANRSASRESDAPGIVAALSIFDDEDLAIDVGSSVVVSPDGSLLAFAGIDDQGPQIYLKRMSKQGVIPIPGTRGGTSPFFSPDGQWIGFFADGMLHKVPSAGGTPIALCEATIPRGGAWSDQGMIVFTGGVASGLSIISENGGTPSPLTEVQTEKHRSHRWPQFLPGGEAVVYMAQLRGRNYDESTIEVVTLEDRVSRQVHEGGSYPRVTSSGHLLFARRGNLYGLPFDPETLETSGSPHVVVQGLFARTSNEATDDGTAHFDVSRDGMLVYREGGPVSEMSKMTILDRAGNLVAESRPGVYATPALSPDASRVAVGVTSGSRVDIWIWDVARDTMTRLTFEGMDNVVPIWSPDGTEVAYSSMRAGSKGSTAQPYVKRADGSGEERPLAPDSPMLGTSGWLTSWSSDDRIIFQSDFQSPETWKINALDLSSGEVRRVVDGPGVDTNGEISPDGQWIAYGSTEAGMAGRPGVFVSRADGSGGRYQVSSGVGLEPRWTRDGSEIIWNGESSGFTASDVYPSGNGLQFGEPHSLFTGRFIVQIPLRAWDVSDDGSRFVVLTPIENTDFDSKSVIVNTNWFPELERLVPGR